VAAKHHPGIRGLCFLCPSPRPFEFCRHSQSPSGLCHVPATLLITALSRGVAVPQLASASCQWHVPLRQLEKTTLMLAERTAICICRSSAQYTRSLGRPCRRVTMTAASGRLQRRTCQCAEHAYVGHTSRPQDGGRCPETAGHTHTSTFCSL
jgi:hypothetical protein